MSILTRFRSLAVLPVLVVLLAASSTLAADKGYDVTFYSVKLELDRPSGEMKGRVEMRARVGAEPLKVILQHAKYLTIDSVFISGVRSSFRFRDTVSGWFEDTAKTAIAAGDTFSVVTYYHGVGRGEQYSQSWGGVQRFSNMMIAMGVGFRAPYISCTRHWMPCYDLPDDKADSARLAFTSTLGDATVSNGLLLSDETTNGKRTMSWKVDHPIATYLMTFATGPYVMVDIPNRNGIPFYIYSEVADTGKFASHIRLKADDALHYFDSLFARYPFEKVGYVLAPIGSMEHQTMVTLDRNAIGAASTTAVHELAHMWWGDWVTCETFDDPWLNEGFATFCESLYLERFSGREAYTKKQFSNVKAAIAGGSRIPLYGAPAATNHNTNYPYAVLYQKGAAVVGMLRQVMGDEAFFNGLREYGRRHAYSTATSFELMSDLEDVSGIDLDWFFDDWVFGIGYPQMKVTWAPGSASARIDIEQVQDSVSDGFFRYPLKIRLAGEGSESVDIIFQLDSTRISSHNFELPFKPTAVLVDPDSVVMLKVTSLASVSAVEERAEERAEKRPLSLEIERAKNDSFSFDVKGVRPLGGIRVNLHDLSGRFVRSLYVGNTGSTVLHFNTDLSGTAAGVYIATAILSDGTTATQALTIVR